MEEQPIILVLEEDIHEENEFTHRKREAFKDNPIVRCERCGQLKRIKKDSNFYQNLLSPDLRNEREEEVEIPESLPFWQCCQPCRDEEGSYLDVAILADHMIEYMSADKEWFFDEVHIEKRWKMSREEIEERAREMRKPLDYIE